MAAFKTNNISTMITLGPGESLIENKRSSGWNVYLTTERLILFNDIGFGDEIEILNSRRSNIESITSRLESPKLFYCIGILFCLSSLVPTVLASLMHKSIPFFWPVLLTPVFLGFGLMFVSKNCFTRRVLQIKLKRGKQVGVPESLQELVGKVCPIKAEPGRTSFVQGLRECFKEPNGRFDFQNMVERLL